MVHGLRQQLEALALAGVVEEAGAIVVGAMTTHSDVLSDPLIARYAPLIAEATT